MKESFEKLPKQLKHFIETHKATTVFVALFLLLFLGMNFTFKPKQVAHFQPFEPLYSLNQTAKMSALLLTYSDTLIAPRYFFDTVRRNILAKQLQKFYQYHNFRPIWLPAGFQIPKTDTLLKVLQRADYEGLNPKNYFTDSIQKSLAYLNSKEAKNSKQVLQTIAKLDMQLSASLLSLVLHRRCGKTVILKERYSFEQWQEPQYFQDSLAMLLVQHLYRKGLKNCLTTLQTQNPHYQALKKELARYLDFAKTQIVEIDFGKDSTYTLKDSSLAIVAIKKRLQVFGDFPQSAVLTPIFDSTLFRAVLRFRFRNAMPDAAKGKVADKDFLLLLSQKPDEIIKKIAVNMERAKWKKYAPADKMLVVNIPDFRVYFYENQRLVSSMKVVVGKKTSPTPIFADTMEYVIFNPTWSVPNSIASKEFLPKVRKNPAYLARNGYVLRPKGGTAPLNAQSINWYQVTEDNFPYHITQKPSKDNALGKVKFIFPNKAQVYLHDTPEKKFFGRAKRAFSHGCVRLECPEEVANYVLYGIKDWNKTKIQKELSKKEINYVVLPKAKRIPVFISYQTAWVDAAGHLQLRADIYEHDKEHSKD
jgi:L,D-transpeptidase YcbB